MSNPQSIQIQAAQLGITSGELIARYAGVSSTSLRRALDGLSGTTETLQKVRVRLSELAVLQHFMLPAPLDFRQHEAIEKLERKLRNQLTVIQIWDSPEEVSDEGTVVKDSEQMFGSVQGAALALSGAVKEQEDA
jgi:hypothetical protein